MSLKDDKILFEEIEGVKFKYRLPLIDIPVRIFLMLHGWTGDEDSMWIFASRLPHDALLIAPRGLYDSTYGGYSWYPREAERWPSLDDFEEAIQAIEGLLSNEWFSIADLSEVRAVGFSQGAALAYSIAFRNSIKLQALSGLSGFVPEGVGNDHRNMNRPLEGLPVFVAHGTQDQIVPVERARTGNQILKEAGAMVTYCEDDVGHKLSTNCFQGLREFFRKN